MRPIFILLGLLALMSATVQAQNSFNLRFGSNFSFEGDIQVDNSVDIIAGIGLIPLITIIDSVNLGVNYRFTPSISHPFVRARLLWLPVSFPGRLGGLVTGGYRYSFGSVHLEGELGLGINDGVDDSSGPFFGTTIRLGVGLPL